jgi:hypothetical protein
MEVQTSNPKTKAIGLLVTKHSFVRVLESKIQGLCGEVSDNIGAISAPNLNLRVIPTN